MVNQVAEMVDTIGRVNRDGGCGGCGCLGGSHGVAAHVTRGICGRPAREAGDVEGVGARECAVAGGRIDRFIADWTVLHGE